MEPSVTTVKWEGLGGWEGLGSLGGGGGGGGEVLSFSYSYVVRTIELVSIIGLAVNIHLSRWYKIWSQ